MKYCFIVNPAAGKSDGKAEFEGTINEICKKRGDDVTVLYTKKAGDACDYIPSFCEQNKGEDIRFFACGGDGTLCEAVNGVMRVPDRERVSLGVVPIGTGNDFVRSFENSEKFLDIEAQLDAIEANIDLIACNDIYAVNMVNIGFDCQVVVNMSDFKRKPFIPSKLAYICGLIVTLVKKPGTRFAISADGGESVDKSLLLATFANGSFCGGGFHSNPNASLCDGRINALFVNNISRTKFIGLVGSYKKGTHLDGSNADILSENKAHSYDFAFEQPVNISVDGEIIKVESLKLTCIPEAIKILVPKGASLKGMTEKAELTV